MSLADGHAPSEWTHVADTANTVDHIVTVYEYYNHAFLGRRHKSIVHLDDISRTAQFQGANHATDWPGEWLHDLD
eukprot:8530622-Pyramimonas_sp.AAC.1